MSCRHFIAFSNWIISCSCTFTKKKKGTYSSHTRVEESTIWLVFPKLLGQQVHIENRNWVAVSFNQCAYVRFQSTIQVFFSYFALCVLFFTYSLSIEMKCMRLVKLPDLSWSCLTLLFPAPQHLLFFWPELVCALHSSAFCCVNLSLIFMNNGKLNGYLL